MNYHSICLMVPTFKRVERVGKFIDSALRTANNVAGLCFSFCVNKKDMATIRYLRDRYWPCEWELILETTRQPNLSLYYNMLYEQSRFNDPGVLVSMVGDDMVFMTPGWDTAVINVANQKDGIAIIYLNDGGIAGERCTVNLFVTRKMVEATEQKFMCPHFHAEMIDVVWTDIGKLTGTLCYLKHHLLKHEHNILIEDASKRDETHQRLAPIQNMTNKDKHQRQMATAWATWGAANIIDKGLAKWVNYA